MLSFRKRSVAEDGNLHIAYDIWYKYWQKHYVVSIDGVEHFCSKKVQCAKCMKRKHRDNTTSNYHPDQKEVFILDNEPIIKQDGDTKNDCERNAAKRMFSNLNSLYSDELMVFVMDALYACNPIVETISANENWKYVINIKEKGNVEWYKKKDSEGEHLFGYINNLELNKSNSGTKVNMLYYIHTDKNGKKTGYSWITNIELTKKI